MAAINTIKSSNRLKIESEGHRHLYLSSTSYSIEWKQTTFGSLEGSVGTAHPRLELKVKSSHGRWKSKLRLPHVNVEHGVIFFKNLSFIFIVRRYYVLFICFIIIYFLNMNDYVYPCMSILGDLGLSSSSNLSFIFIILFIYCWILIQSCWSIEIWCPDWQQQSHHHRQQQSHHHRQQQSHHHRQQLVDSCSHECFCCSRSRY